ncbi:hypothetical protein L207DRAFT_496987 [Hyaloscypha variabilis F]|uniref:Uncharacterized protein n=1 Tax=Hyaloscypha variabilis (strain UAMH 11265 / GT02V1 / F) TaxID=1149755 RepID=A0A2J6R906_HYAVF|nr:hypothetical protein L207DRAFT_496987 [Hyaloscypha variabilis F]
MLSVRYRNTLLTCSAVLFVFLATSYLVHFNSNQERVLPGSPEPPPPASSEYKPKYKPAPEKKSYPIIDNFPLAAAAHSAADLPPIAEWNRPPSPHVPEQTPLFIGFTRNWRILQQVVVSYINAGWPPSDIYVIENTGVMDSNKRGLLSLQNPFFLNHTRLNMLGVNILVTPTLLTFAQLQNFYLYTSIDRKWDHYFWSHMDVVVVSYEKDYKASQAQTHSPILPPSNPHHNYTTFRSLYTNCVSELRNATQPSPSTGQVPRWAMRFFAYDHLALVNVAAFVEVGGWDTLIPFYYTDCDMHARLEMAEFEIKDANAGYVYDVASSLDDLVVLYRKKGGVEASFTDPNVEREEVKDVRKSEDGNLQAKKEVVKGGKEKWEDDEIASERFEQLERTLDAMGHSKGAASGGRNTWQARQTGGQGDPFYRDSAGFEKGIWMTIEHGKRVFAEKWGHRDCDIRVIGLRPEDAWIVEHDWE